MSGTDQVVLALSMPLIGMAIGIIIVFVSIMYSGSRSSNKAKG